MQDVEMGTEQNGGGVEEAKKESGSSSNEEEDKGLDGMVLGVLISQPEEPPPPRVSVSKSTPERDDKVVAAKKGLLGRTDSYHEVCRVCQQQTEEPLLDLGCSCRGELAKAHGSCIEAWFRTKGSNRCEICQQVAVNIPSPQTQPSRNYWIWRVDPISRGSTLGWRGHGCCSPLWLAFIVLIGGLLLDVLISVSLGISALPVNIIIGVLIILGLGTAFRLAVECCQEWNLRRELQATNTTVNPGLPPTV